MDITGLGHNGTLINGGTYGAGKVGKAFSFNGTDYVQVPKSTAWDFGTKDFTIDLWVNFTTVKNSGCVPCVDNAFIADDQGPGNIPKWIFTLSGGALTLITGEPAFLAQTPFSPTPGTWYLLSRTRHRVLHDVDKRCSKHGHVTNRHYRDTTNKRATDYR